MLTVGIDIGLVPRGVRVGGQGRHDAEPGPGDVRLLGSVPERPPAGEAGEVAVRRRRDVGVVVPVDRGPAGLGGVGGHGDHVQAAARAPDRHVVRDVGREVARDVAGVHVVPEIDVGVGGRGPGVADGPGAGGGLVGHRVVEQGHEDFVVPGGVGVETVLDLDRAVVGVHPGVVPAGDRAGDDSVGADHGDRVVVGALVVAVEEHDVILGAGVGGVAPHRVGHVENAGGSAGRKLAAGVDGRAPFVPGRGDHDLARAGQRGDAHVEGIGAVVRPELTAQAQVHHRVLAQGRGPLKDVVHAVDDPRVGEIGLHPDQGGVGGHPGVAVGGLAVSGAPAVPRGDPGHVGPVAAGIGDDRGPGGERRLEILGAVGERAAGGGAGGVGLVPDAVEAAGAPAQLEVLVLVVEPGIHDADDDVAPGVSAVGGSGLAVDLGDDVGLRGGGVQVGLEHPRRLDPHHPRQVRDGKDGRGRDVGAEHRTGLGGHGDPQGLEFLPGHVSLDEATHAEARVGGAHHPLRGLVPDGVDRHLEVRIDVFPEEGPDLLGSRERGDRRDRGEGHHEDEGE